MTDSPYRRTIFKKIPSGDRFSVSPLNCWVSKTKCNHFVFDSETSPTPRIINIVPHVTNSKKLFVYKGFRPVFGYELEYFHQDVRSPLWYFVTNYSPGLGHELLIALTTLCVGCS